MAKTLWRFTVEGSGEFPIDMLRYDGCWPMHQTDSVVIQDNDQDNRRVELLSYTYPTDERWRSFCWRVVGAAERV